MCRWLQLADDLQLDDLKYICLKKSQDMALESKFGLASLQNFVSVKDSAAKFDTTHLLHAPPPEVNRHVKGLSRAVLEDLLAGIVATCNL